ncbi:MaoC family dehydratase [Streptomyces chiangmaiensis]|uniref:MaoC/PaaZ C-terminal domain-containing protein n=1 Tax=Streptomyces chiangmaiensis TaxID=766497 RepID=A0ABU7FDD0_9ACTN|nr:MaoC/PaaZ C-terminal domain-containing protein [Streptomyces chiangmaiensis]MED7821890.1 MaoC/PaaZ C-terminal domain-containing protein [Streptomyces chiangmaiensis]
MLLPVLLRGALLAPFKRPGPDAAFPRDRLVLPGVRIEPARLAAYERVCGFPGGADALPVTCPQVLGFPLAMRIMASRQFPLPLLGLVHTSIEITQREALAPDGAYDIEVRTEKLLPHRRGTEAVVVTEVRTTDRIVWESTSTYLARHRTALPAEASPSAPRPLPASAEWRLAGDIGRRYAAVSGDRNPIHLHALTARVFGFPRAIAHGMWTVARCLAEQPTPAAVHVRVQFRAPVLLPGTVTYAADGGRFELRGGERLHLTGETRRLDG